LDIVKNDCIDFIVIGEGELTTLELVEALEKGNTNYQDIIWRRLIIKL